METQNNQLNYSDGNLNLDFSLSFLLKQYTQKWEGNTSVPSTSGLFVGSGNMAVA